MKLLFVSNGYGEDQIASNLIVTLKKKDPAVEINGLPLVGQGGHYTKIGIMPLVKNEELPSGGFIRGVSELIKDMRAGLVQQHRRHVQVVKDLRGKFDGVVAVGDVYALFIASFNHSSSLYFLPTAKSDHFMKHTKLEYYFIKKWAKRNFPRDELTTESFRAMGLDAHYCGNPMMDGLMPSKDFTLRHIADGQVLGILPGSRNEAYTNLSHILKVAEKIHELNPKIIFVVAKADTLSLEMIGKLSSREGWQVLKESPYTYLTHFQKKIKILVSSQFTDVLHASKVVLGLSGTANEQAVHLGKPVYCFEGFGPQSTRQRFQEQQLLLQGKTTFIQNRDPVNVARHLVSAFQQVANQQQEGETRQNACRRIVDIILNDLNGHIAPGPQ